MRFSANLGFLWNDRPLAEAIRCAAHAGFDAVECHFPFRFPAQTIRAALEDVGIPMIGLNTVPGDLTAGDFGLCAVPERINEARAAIDQAIDYACSTGTRAVHVMAGKARGSAARDVFLENLSYAADRAKDTALTLLIEPINIRDVPGYFLNRTGQAEEILGDLGRSNVKLMFDCYHVEIMEGDVCAKLERLLPVIGHVQIASVPERAEPDTGDLDYRHVVKHLDTLGYGGYVGAEYKPAGDVEQGLGWLASFRD
ncbi:hydroxypyruvate isomerase family protein [Roseibium sp.]|uniref:hydroxypyruvate isomerase family protein n=1 Tax=Roseibium sp. TaxID=1936156 RepID=UPI003A96DF91